MFIGNTMANETRNDAVIWKLTREDIERANATALMRELGLRSWGELHALSVKNQQLHEI